MVLAEEEGLHEDLQCTNLVVLKRKKVCTKAYSVLTLWFLKRKKICTKTYSVLTLWFLKRKKVCTKTYTLQCTNLVVLEEEEGLHEGEDEMTDVDEDEDVGLTRGRVLCLKVGGNVEPIQGDAADTESWKSQRRQCMKCYITEFTMLF